MWSHTFGVLDEKANRQRRPLDLAAKFWHELQTCERCGAQKSSYDYSCRSCDQEARGRADPVKLAGPIKLEYRLTILDKRVNWIAFVLLVNWVIAVIFWLTYLNK